MADYWNRRVQVLTPTLDFHAFIGVGQLTAGPAGVCANADIVVVSEAAAHAISVFNRCDGALLRRFGSEGSGDSQLIWPRGLCFMLPTAVALSVFSVEGEFVRHIGVGQLKVPHGVACSASDQLVVADFGNNRIFVFSATGELLKTIRNRLFTGVAMRGDTVFVHDSGEKCVSFNLAALLCAS